MGDQRKKFRIRLPWLISSAPAPRPANVTKRVPSRVTSTQNTAPASESKTSTQPNANPTTSTAQRAPSRSPGVSQTQTPKPPPQPPTSTKTDSQPTTTESPDTTAQATIKNRIPTPSSSAANQPSAESQIPSKTTHTPMVPDDLTSPLRSPKQFVSQNSLPQAQASPKTESQPSSSSPAGFGSRTSTQTASQTRASAQRQAKSQPPSPSNTSQSRPPSQPPSPSHSSFQTVSQSSSPAHSQQKNSSPILRQPRSPSHQPSGQTTKNMQLTSGIPAQTSSPSKTLNPRESTMPPPTSSNPPSPVSESKRRALSQPQPLEAQPTKNISDDIISKSLIKATIQPAPRSTEPTLMAAKKMAENTNAVENQEMVAQKEASRLREHTKEPSGIAFQAEEKKQETRELLKKEVLNSNTPTSNGKQSKTMAPQQRNKNMVGESRQRPMASNREGVSMQKEIKNDISKFAHSMATEQKKPVSVMTLVGENKGATMQIGSDSAKREAAVHIHRGYKLNSDESAETTSDGEETSQKRRGAEANTKENQTTKAYMNSNTQGLNNSLLFNTSIAERNPGVHLVLSRNPTEPIKMDNSTNNLEAHKAEASITPSQKLTYEPTIRRRCLRGLIMESSDSEPDNPEKPRRHGCRCSYGDINKDKEIELL